MLRFITLTALITFCLPHISYAQNSTPEPIHYKGFKILPALGYRTTFINNVFAENTDTDNDIIVAFEPSLTINHNIRDHQINMNAYGNIIRYLDHETENIDNYGASFFGLIHATSRIKLPYTLEYKRDHQQRNRERTGRVSKEPIAFETVKAEIGANYRPNRLNWLNTFRYEQKRFDNGQALDGSTLIRDDGDYDLIEYETRLEYETKTAWTPFIGLTICHSNFLRPSAIGSTADEAERDNINLSSLFGLRYIYHDIFEIEAGLGQGSINYDSNKIDDINTLAISASMRWAPSPRTSYAVNIIRETEDDTDINQGIVKTGLTLSANHELSEGLFLNGLMGYDHEDFENDTRKDDIYEGQISLLYSVNANTHLESALSYLKRESNESGLSFDQSAIMVFLKTIF